MIHRLHLSLVRERLGQFPAVGLLGPRQIGKTTLAKIIAQETPSVYLDLEDPRDRIKISDLHAYLELHPGKLIIMDEIQHMPEIFSSLRGIIDAKRQGGQKAGHFLILGSASLDLLRQSSESLAGRISYVEMGSINAQELEPSPIPLSTLWLRGGFPDSLLAETTAHSLEWRTSFIKTYLERDIPQIAPHIPAATLHRLWSMLAYDQGCPQNDSKMAQNLTISSQTVARYMDLMEDLFLIRRLMPWHGNYRKRLVKTPKVYVRDSGIMHALSHIRDMEQLLVHPVLGMSWEGFVIDNLIQTLPTGGEAYFYRSARGAEIDLILNLPNGPRIAIEIKRSTTPVLTRGFFEGCVDVQPTHRYVVYNGTESFPLSDGIIATPIATLMAAIKKL